MLSRVGHTHALRTATGVVDHLCPPIKHPVKVATIAQVTGAPEQAYAAISRQGGLTKLLVQTFAAPRCGFYRHFEQTRSIHSKGTPRTGDGRVCPNQRRMTLRSACLSSLK